MEETMPKPRLLDVVHVEDAAADLPATFLTSWHNGRAEKRAIRVDINQGNHPLVYGRPHTIWLENSGFLPGNEPKMENRF